MIPKSAVKTMTLSMLPFADAASDELPLGQLLRLSLVSNFCGHGRGDVARDPKPGDDR